MTTLREYIKTLKSLKLFGEGCINQIAICWRFEPSEYYEICSIQPSGEKNVSVNFAKTLDPVFATKKYILKDIFDINELFNLPMGKAIDFIIDSEDKYEVENLTLFIEFRYFDYEKFYQLDAGKSMINLNSFPL